MPLSRRYSIVRLFLFGMISVVVLTSFLLWGEWYFDRKIRFEQDVVELREQYLAQQKELISHQVDSAIDSIRDTRTQLEEQRNERLKNRVYEAHQLATHLYQRYQGEKPRAEIFSLVKEILRGMNSNDGCGGFFAINLDGSEELGIDQPEGAGQHLLEFRGARGPNLIREMLTVVKKDQEGFYTYRGSKPHHQGQDYPKISFIKLFAPANWVIGSCEYQDDLDQKVKAEALKRISNVHFGKEGFLFVVDYDSRVVYHPNQKVVGRYMLKSEKPELRMAFPKILTESKKTGQMFIDYLVDRSGSVEFYNKTSYFSRVPEWRWLVASGFYHDNLDAAVTIKRDQLHREIFSDTWRMVLLSLILILCSALTTRMIASRLQHNMALFNNFLANAASSSCKIPEENVTFREFEQLAQAANQMIDERSRSEEENRLLEAQLFQSQKLEAVGTLAGGIAHDFNNLLAAISGNLSLLSLKMDENDQRRKYLDRLNDAADKAKELVRQILSFSRFADGQETTIDLTAAVRESLKLLRSTIPRSVEIVSELPATACPVGADKTQIHQVMMNLCNNAYQAMPNHAGTIQIGLKTLSPEELPPSVTWAELGRQQIIYLSISDDGAGVAPEIQSKIFDPFFSTKGDGKGTGLGLAMVHRVILRSRGKIQVESQSEQGTTFHIYLPKASEAELVQAVGIQADIHNGTGNILLVDDDQAVLESTAELVQQLGYQVQAFSAPETALEYFTAHADQIQILMTDQTMPGISGIELIRKVRSIKPELSIILCTGYSDQVDEQTADKLQISRVLMKPADLSELSKAIQEQLKNSINPTNRSLIS